MKVGDYVRIDTSKLKKARFYHPNWERLVKKMIKNGNGKVYITNVDDDIVQVAESPAGAILGVADVPKFAIIENAKKLKNYMFDKKEIRMLNESIFPEEKPMSPAVKEKALSAIKEYNKFGKMIYREGNLVDIAKTLGEIAQFAEKYTVENASEWFDTITIKRNMNELKKLSEEFRKVSGEVQSYQNKMTALYEDMGHILNRYFEIEDIADDASEPEDDGFIKKGDEINVNMTEVRKYDSTPSYIREVKTELAKGKGKLIVQRIRKDNGYVVASHGRNPLVEVIIPISAISKKKKINEEVKFDAYKMKELIISDKFLSSQFKMNTGTEKDKLLNLFNKYVKGDSDMESRYNSMR